MVSDEISWHVELQVQLGRLVDFRSLTEEMVEAATAEKGALIYERFIDGARRRIWIYERYSDSPAAVLHLGRFAAVFGERFSSMVIRRRFVVFGSPSPELKGILDEMDAVYFEHFAGFSVQARKR